MPVLIVVLLSLFAPVAAQAEALSLNEFAVFQEEMSGEEAAQVRQDIVRCLQATRAPRTCIGTTVRACNEALLSCAARETIVWEQYGYDIYLALRRALGGPDWIDAAHVRIGAEMAIACDARLAEAGVEAAEVCRLRAAAQRALDLRFALIAP